MPAAARRLRLHERDAGRAHVGRWPGAAHLRRRERGHEGADCMVAMTPKRFEEQAARRPRTQAIVCGSFTLTYGELNERANQVAHYLRTLGVGPDVLVGVCMERTPLLIIALLGIWKAGGAYVPLDRAYPRERLQFMLGDAGVVALVTDGKSRPLLPFDDRRTVCLDRDAPRIAQESRHPPALLAEPSHLAYVMYTSGSTGRPKGAMITHGGLANYLAWAIDYYRIEPAASVPVHSPISFDLTVTSLYPPLLVGGEVELLPED